MTLDEAKKVAEILDCADSGCKYCVGALCEVANEVLPEFVWTLNENNMASVKVRE